MKTLYNKAKNDRWEPSEVCMAIIARFGTGGGNIPIVLETDETRVDTLVFDEAQITCPTCRSLPQWNGVCHTLSKDSGRSVVIIK